MFFIGIDWAAKHLDFCLTNDKGDVILRDRVDNDDDGFNSLLQAFEKEKIEFHKKVRAKYLEIARDNPERVKVLSTDNKGIEAIEREIQEIVNAKLRD